MFGLVRLEFTTEEDEPVASVVCKFHFQSCVCAQRACTWKIQERERGSWRTRFLYFKEVMREDENLLKVHTKTFKLSVQTRL